MRLMLLSLALFGLAACQAEAPPATSADTAAGPTPPPAAPVDTGEDLGTPAPEAAASDPAAVLAGKTWRVERRSDGGEVGATYAFGADGTLVVDSPNGTPMTGSWRADGSALSLTEEGIAHPTDLVVRDADHVTLRSHNPGGVVEIALVRAPDVPLPGR
jgi:hypothetical protein